MTDDSGALAVAPLLTEAHFCAALGVSERKFKELRAAGFVPDPIELGPRAPRWTAADYAETLRRLPRRASAPEPTRLSEGRRARIDALKAGGVPA